MSFCSSHGADLSKGICKDCRIQVLESALWAQQCAVEYRSEHYRQSDNGWQPSPGFERGVYEAKVSYETTAERLRLHALGMESWKHDAPHENGGPTYYWVVERTYPSNKPKPEEPPRGFLATVWDRFVTSAQDDIEWARVNRPRMLEELQHGNVSREGFGDVAR